MVRFHGLAVTPILALLACGGQSADIRQPGPATGTPENTETHQPPSTSTSPGSTLYTTPLVGFIGSPCTGDSDCEPGGVCLLDTEGFLDGMCTEPCDEFCPDAAGYPTTFCAVPDRMPSAAGALGDVCASRCDFSAYPGTGCRVGYGCAYADRSGEPGVEGLICQPELDSELPECIADLAARGVGFETNVIADAPPADHPELLCHIEDPVKVHTPLLGIEIRYIESDTSAGVAMACEGARALADTALDVTLEDVAILHHYGTVNCRVIAGTDTLSRHAYGDAIDVAAFTFEDGTYWTVYDDWEDGDTTPESDAGEWLYDTVHRWDDDDLWNILLTPEYNAAHDDHFHVDMTPGADFLGMHGAVPPVAVVLEGLESRARPVP
jgi:hypothetical protein